VLTGEVPWKGLNPMQIGMALLAKDERPPVARRRGEHSPSASVEE